MKTLTQYLSQLSIAVTKHLRQVSIKESFISAHGFRTFSLWSVGSLALGSVVIQGSMEYLLY